MGSLQGQERVRMPKHCFFCGCPIVERYGKGLYFLRCTECGRTWDERREK